LRRRPSNGSPGPPARDQRVLVIGLGNPEPRYAGTRHNIGFEIVAELARRWELPRPRQRYRGLIAEGRAGPGGPRVAVLRPQTFMNESGASAGPARGALKVPLEMVVALHDEIDLPFGEVRSKLGGGVAGHNGLRSLAQGLGGRDFWRVRAGVGRPESTDPEVVAAYVLSRFAEPEDQVRELIDGAADEAERLIREICTDGSSASPPEPPDAGAGGAAGPRS
jgi:PTH1 family peptidyl-tRNA hydrolase